jgi:hypothetical protein
MSSNEAWREANDSIGKNAAEEEKLRSASDALIAANRNVVRQSILSLSSVA